MKYVIIILSCFVLPYLSLGQQDQKDLGFREYVRLVKTNHPVSKQAALLNAESKAVMQRSRGMLDPRLGANVEQKYFRDDNYFRFIDGNVNLPSIYGVELNAGYDLNDGVNLNPADLLPSSGLIHVGVKVDLLRGLLFNERRAALAQAELFQTANNFEREIILNELYSQATMAYIRWQAANEKEKLADSFVDLAYEMLDGARQLYNTGDGRAIDTLEALINLNTRKNERLTIRTQVVNEWQEMNAFLWNEAGEPLSLELAESSESLDSSLFRNALDSVVLALSGIVQSHPQLNRIQNRYESLKVEERLLKENLKPRLTVQYNPFIYRWDERAFNDYKWKLGFQMPLLFREARGELELNRIEIENTDLKMKNQENKIVTYTNALYNEIVLLEEQLIIQNRVVEESQILASAEKTNFRIGESTIFLVNQREQKWYSQRQKLIDLKVKLVAKRLSLLALLNVTPSFV